jgi:hypothetical protein
MPRVAENLTKEQRLAGWKRLTDKQQSFLDNFMHKDMTQTNSARQAGYANPGVDAVRLLRNPVVQERYQEMREEARTRFGVTIDKSVRDLLKIRNEAWESGKFGEAIRAEELRLKATGLLVNKAHVLHERTDKGAWSGVDPRGSWVSGFRTGRAMNCSVFRAAA